MTMEVRIRYWYQDTAESGRWCVSGTMTLETAKIVVQQNVYERAEIVLDEEGWPRYEGIHNN